ncbi:aldo/keto reductase [Dactylosporangium sp. AC04546]|uniref:aldo/keto reductase n=1 Tax=Dactylosporangium sp. AC04546 TaxID=2862460 RepID=UPI001EDE45B3|nr:aldo/keto reductase [Dactylosporangium sp. AC04546]WVK85979.1 aldo/keto reductase [Dactylosporangium sp. AC04546]
MAETTAAELGLGCAQLGNLYHAIDDERARATVDAAWDAGIRYFDTAPHYGIGLSERRLGMALRDRPRQEYRISTKVGRLLVETGEGGLDIAEGFVVPATHKRVRDFSHDGVRRSIDDSLTRLGLDRIDVALLHDPEGHTEVAFGEGWRALTELRDEGVVTTLGAGSKDAAVLARFVRECGPDVVMVAGRFTLLEQPARDELLPACAAHGVGVLNAGVFNSGLLAEAKPHDGLPYEYGTAPEPLVERARAIADLCTEHGTSLPAAALAFAGSDPAVRSVVVGADSPEQVRRNAALFATPPPGELWPALRERGLL